MTAPCRLLLEDHPQRPAPWHAVYDQARRWMATGCFETSFHDLRKILRLVEGRDAKPTAAEIDSRTVRSECEKGPRSG